MKVIETSILFDSFGDIWDTQSRVLEVDDWEDYIKEIKGERIPVIREVELGMRGKTKSLYDANFKKAGRIYRETEYNIIYKSKMGDGYSIHTSYKIG